MNHSKYPLLLAACACVVVGLATGGCDSRPTEADAQQSFSYQVTSQSKDRMHVKRFEKTNGQARESAGVQLYQFEYASTVEVVADCKWLFENALLGEHDGFQTVELPRTRNQTDFSWQKWQDDVENPGQLLRKGQLLNISGALVFEKTEKGWRMTDIATMKLSGSQAPVEETRRAEVKPSELKEVSVVRPETYLKLTLEFQRASDLCVEKLKTIGVGAELFSNDNGDVLPMNLLSLDFIGNSRDWKILAQESAWTCNES